MDSRYVQSNASQVEENADVVQVSRRPVRSRLLRQLADNAQVYNPYRTGDRVLVRGSHPPSADTAVEGFDYTNVFVVAATSSENEEDERAGSDTGINTKIGVWDHRRQGEEQDDESTVSWISLNRITRFPRMLEGFHGTFPEMWSSTFRQRVSVSYVALVGRNVLAYLWVEGRLQSTLLRNLRF